FHSPPQNIVYADRTGTIGFTAAARVPIRRRGDGRQPVPGWSGAYDWIGEIPFAALPMMVNPPSGRIVAANNKIVPDDYPYLLTARWRAPYRARRIEDLLDGIAPLAGAAPGTPEGAQAMQQDVISLAARELLALLLQTKPTSERGREALAILRNWDGAMRRDSPAPLIFYAWVKALNSVLMADELGPDFPDFQHSVLERLTSLLRTGALWCDDVTTQDKEDCPQQLARALEMALNDLAIRFRRPVGRLQWGEAHIFRFAHPVLNNVPILGTLFEKPVSVAGGSYTINRAGVGFSDRSRYMFEDIYGPGYRAVYDLADLDNSRFMIATGQSGNPLSPFYGNLTPRWRDGDYIKLAGGGKAPAHRLVLTPR
ncbi:MAG: penicillin acylase family protein, partial [Alphaproteobacteria bacterium]